MSGDEALVRVRLQKILGPTAQGAAVLLGDAGKTFVIFIGEAEAVALLRELRGEAPARPLTHDLLGQVLLGFDIAVKKVVISSLAGHTFFATLILEQKVLEEGESWVGKRNEVRIDARPSDCFVLAAQQKAELYVTRAVYEQVQDVKDALKGLSQAGGLAVGDLGKLVSSYDAPPEGGEAPGPSDPASPPLEDTTPDTTAFDDADDPADSDDAAAG